MNKGGWNDDALFLRTNADRLPECHMWRHVIKQAILDASGTNHSLRLEVGQWLQEQDFETVCILASCNPDPIKSKMKEILMAKWPVSWVLGIALRKALLYDDDVPDD